jgi:molybdopterin-containing oxidoreductase family iron-sulfur binding subunit
VFGDINDPDSEVSRLRRDGRHYALLEEQGTRPRTTYLARWNDKRGDRQG